MLQRKSPLSMCDKLRLSSQASPESSPRPPAIACKVWLPAPLHPNRNPLAARLQTHERNGIVDRRYGNETERFQRGNAVEDVAVYQAIVMLCLGGQLHNVEIIHLRRFHCQRASTPHRLAGNDHPRRASTRRPRRRRIILPSANHRRAEHNRMRHTQTLCRHPPTDKPLREFAGAWSPAFAGNTDIAIPLLKKAVLRLHQFISSSPERFRPRLHWLASLRGRHGWRDQFFAVRRWIINRPPRALSIPAVGQ